MIGIVLTCFSVFILQSFSYSAAEERSSFSRKGYTFNITFQLDYPLFVLKSHGQSPVPKWPLIIFLHGVGEHTVVPVERSEEYSRDIESKRENVTFTY
jgi:hypothetical protein